MGRFTLKREHFIPANGELQDTGDLPCEAYYYTDSQGRASMTFFTGRKAKPTYHYYFLNEEARAKSFKNCVAGVQAEVDCKAERKAECAAFRTSLKVGDILYESWGYDQTNVFFYQVVEVLPSGKSVRIRSIAKDYTADGFMSGKSVARKGDFTGEAFLKRVTIGNNISLSRWAAAWLWDGKPKYESHYA